MTEEILNDELQETEEVEETEEVKSYDFPDTTVFYDRIIETDTYKCLGNV